MKEKDKKNKTEVAELEKLQNQLKEEKENTLKVLADFENFKKRILKEREDLNLMANASILNILLDVRDDLARGIESLGDKEIPVGFTLILDKIKNILAEQGIVEIEVKPGDEFNPKFMEAIGTITVKDEKQNNRVIHLERKGFKLKDKEVLIRTCRVIVGKLEK